MATSTIQRAMLGVFGAFLLWSPSATAETVYVDNVPDEDDFGPVSGSYNLYSDRCQPQSVEVDDPRCLAGQAVASPSRTVTVGCTPNTRPPYHIGGTCPAPRAIQTTRAVPIQQDAVDANRMVQASIARTYPDSVWQFYKLVNV